MTAADLADALLLTQREAEEHITHLRRSLGEELRMRPAVCGACNFVFKGRKRLDAPGRCPSCKQQRVQGPWFRI